MKTYIKPNTEIHSIEIESIMQTGSPTNHEEIGGDQLSKDVDISNTPSSPSLWDEEEE